MVSMQQKENLSTVNQLLVQIQDLLAGEGEFLERRKEI